jgi:hypothetical protein
MRDLVFISYAHEDRAYRDKLQVHLAPLIRNKVIEDWSDEKIAHGGLWKDEIKAALARTQLGILLVSPYFLASRFIAEEELPPLLDAAKADQATILWIPISHSLYKETKIADYQAASDPGTPLKSLSEVEQDRVMVDICHAIKAVTWSLEIKLDNPGPLVDLKTKISGKVIFRGRGDSSETLTSWMTATQIRLVPYVFSPDARWWAQKPLDPDPTGNFSSEIWVGDEKSSGKDFTIIVCAASEIRWGGAPKLPEVRRESVRYDVRRK